MLTYIVITGCIGVGIFIGMVLSAAFSTNSGHDMPEIEKVFPAKECYHCSEYGRRLDRAV